MVELKTVETVDTSPFKKLVITIGELPTSFVESMTYYELLAWFTNYLQNTIIPAVNNNGEAVTELQEKFVELKNFVDTYFENLDVQEEINNKLDEMAADGTLEALIAQYIQANVAWTFDTVADMQASDKLINGTYARTLGYNSLNDDGGNLYFITDTTSSSVIQETLTSGLYASVYGKEVTASQLGMIANDNSKTTANFDKLANALDKGYIVTIDKAYYIDKNEIFTIHADNFIIKGIEGIGKLLVKPAADDRYYFDVEACNVIDISNVTIENTTTYKATFLKNGTSTLWHLNEFNFKNNNVEGPICVFRASYDTTASPVLGNHGFDFVTVCDNKFHNITGLACFYFFDTIARKVSIRNNYVHNFTNNFFGLITTNGSTYEDETRLNVKLVEVDNNYVICDDDYIEEPTGSYYCFILLEGDVCRYTNNHVEGIKSFEDKAVYDVYLSVNKLYSSNNVFKNNMLFYNNVTSYLLKSKSGVASQENLERYYDNNTYIIDEAWQAQFDNSFTYSIGFIDLTEPCTVYQVSNCYFDIPKLRGRSANSNAIEYGELVFKDNYMRIRRSTQSNLFFTRSTSQTNTVCIEDNVIIDEGHNISLFGASAGVQDEVTYYNIDKVIINNNKFEGRRVLNEFPANYVEMCNNEFTFTGTDASPFYSTSVTSPEMKFKRNTIANPTGTTYVLRAITGDNIIDIENEFYADLPNNANYQGLILSTNIDTQHVHRYFFEYEIYHTTGKQVMSFYVDYGKDENGNYIKLLNTSNVEVTLYKTDSGINIHTDDATSVTTSTARVGISASKFVIVPKISYAIANTPCFIKQTIKSVQLS